MRAWAAYRCRPVMLHGLDAAALGPAFWHAAERRLGAVVVVECGADAGTVLAALRVGVVSLRHRVDGPQAAALDALIEVHGAVRVRETVDLELAAGRPASAQLARWCFVHGDRSRASW